MQVERAGQTLSLAVPAGRVGTVPAEKPAADSAYRFLTPDVGYLDMARLSRRQVPAALQTFAHTKGIVIDQRNYPAPIFYELAAQLAPQPVPFATYIQRDPSSPGRFLWQPADSVKASGPAAYPGRVVVLVNEKSRSMAEFTAMGLRATPHCLLLGSQTAGADGNASKIILPGGLNTLMTGLGVYYPDRGETQQVGLRLDVTLRPTVAGIQAGRDELRDRAVELIQRPVTNAN